MTDFFAGFTRAQAFTIYTVALELSVLLIVLAIGMSASWSDATFLFRNPALLARSILARNILLPIAAIVMLKLFPFPPAVAITIAVLAITPIPPIMPKSLLKAGGRPCYIFGLLVSQAALAIVIVPLTVEVMSQMFSVEVEFSVADVAKVVLKTILLPFLAGLAIDALFGEQAHRAGRIIATTGNVLLICVVIPMVPFAWSALQTLVGQGVLAGLAALVIIGLATGHLLGGPDPFDRTVLALATASAHPGVAIAIASANFPKQTKLVAGAVVIYMFVRALLVIPYTRWRRRPSAHGGDVHIAVRA